METLTGKYSKSFDLMSKSVKYFLDEIEKHNLSDMATDEWSVKDELCHIAFWHDYYAQNYSALAKGVKPFVFPSKGGSTRNQDGVDKLRGRDKKFLYDLIKKSSISLYNSIVVKKVPKMTYIIGKEYKTEKFLEIVTEHIKRHTLLVKRSKKINN